MAWRRPQPSTAKVETVTGLNTDNSDPTNPVVEIAVDGSSITGAGTPGDPLVAYGTGVVTSVNGEVGAVTLTSDDISDTAQTHKFTTASDITKLAGIEAGADVTDSANVMAGLTVVPIANGGTNSSTSLSNNRVMVSNSGAVKEAAAITASRGLKSDSNGLPVHFDTATDPSLTELSYVKGVSSAIQTQIDAKAPDFAPVSLIFTTNANADTTSSSFADLSGMTNQSFSVPVTRDYMVTFMYKAHTTTAGSNDMDVQLVFDSAGTPNIISFPEVELASANWSAMTVARVVNLTAGSHTVKPQFARTFGSQTIRVDNGKSWYVTISL